jgi:hypothetical protein
MICRNDTEDEIDTDLLLILEMIVDPNAAGVVDPLEVDDLITNKESLIGLY